MNSKQTKLSGTERRDIILSHLKNDTKPISATAIAAECNVSRQVIVQDIALIRASGYNIISTNRGYIINSVPTVSRVFKVFHTDEQLQEELETIVDLGGYVENVLVHHKAYGTLEAELGINSRRRINEFLESIHSGKSKPLKNITSNYHYHTVTADSEKTLDLVENALREKAFLVEQK